MKGYKIIPQSPKERILCGECFHLMDGYHYDDRLTDCGKAFDCRVQTPKDYSPELETLFGEPVRSDICIDNEWRRL